WVLEYKDYTNREWEGVIWYDEYSLEKIGGTFGISFVWWDKMERWHTDCMGIKKKPGSSVMCWGMIGYGWKGPFHVWDPETEKEKQEAESEILSINTEMEEEAEKANTIWKNSAEWTELRLQELAIARLQRQAEKHGAPKKKIDQIWRHKMFKVEKLKWSEYIRGVDAWRYVKHVAIPLMWPECHRQLQRNPDFVLMEDGASPHTANYTSREREKQGVSKLDWVSNSPDFNPIERIWTLLKRRIQRRCATERVTTVTDMKLVLREEWEKITVEEINREIDKLPTIVSRCLAVNGGNNFHA
ncbi:hypothetical protein K440DRAFT_545932, partial [Wilcoxina mikolae CBS 423.85]